MIDSDDQAELKREFFERLNGQQRADIAEEENKTLRAENARLLRVIAKELTENDDLGAEFTYVNALKAENSMLKEEFSELQKQAFPLIEENARMRGVLDHLLSMLDGEAKAALAEK